ncbi:MAG: hypothetical protein O7G85_12925 [Planctomycetota bacterium]|nr:hypothetical protein [Planctomycetota bacterium]
MIQTPDQPKARIVLLGASNLTIGIRRVLCASRDTLALTPSDELDVMISFGRGRSYGIDSSLLGRTLPGIVECGLWDDLQPRDTCPTFALLTDIGNDVMYGIEPETILSWVRTCLDRLEIHSAKIVMTALPMARIRSIRPIHFRLMKALLFPRHAITYPLAMDRTEQLDVLLRQLARERSIPLIEPDVAWYGVDPIHIKWSRRREAWETIVKGWTEHASANRTGRCRLSSGWTGSWLWRPQKYSRSGRERYTPQPSIHLRPKTTVAMY